MGDPEPRLPPGRGADGAGGPGPGHQPDARRHPARSRTPRRRRHLQTEPGVRYRLKVE